MPRTGRVPILRKKKQTFGPFLLGTFACAVLVLSCVGMTYLHGFMMNSLIESSSPVNKGLKSFKEYSSSSEEVVDGILQPVTFYLETNTIVTDRHKPLPIRHTRAKELKVVPLPKASCTEKGLLEYPIDDFPIDDPFLPWIHDVFVIGNEVRIVAQNKRRCEIGKDKEDIMRKMEPQLALFQPVPIDAFNRTHYKLSTDKAEWPETRFFCHFHNATGITETTLSRFPIPYEFVNWRKHHGEFMFSRKKNDNNLFEFSQLIFYCPVPSTFRGQSEVFLDIIPIRTPPRAASWMLTERHVGPNVSLPYFDPETEYGDQHILPSFHDSGRIANLPLCPVAPVLKKHKLVVCTWTSEAYQRRGNEAHVDDAADRLREWILFHRIVGVDHIYVYDNSKVKDHNKSRMEQISSEYPDFVTHVPWTASICNNNRPNHKNPGERSSQYAAEASCRERYGSTTDWMSFIDTDEYLVPMRNQSWHELLTEYEVNNPEVRVWKMRSSRGRPRVNLMKPLANQSQCGESSRQHKVPLSPCLRPKQNETFLRVYNCDFIRPPRPDRFKRAMKQIYQPFFVLSHFVHYATITEPIARYYEKYKEKSTFTRKVAPSDWGDSFMDELEQGVLVHTKTVLPAETMLRETGCVNGERHSTCAVGHVCPASTPFDDANHQSSPFRDADGDFCNCWVNEFLEDHWLPMLERELRLG